MGAQILARTAAKKKLRRVKLAANCHHTVTIFASILVLAHICGRTKQAPNRTPAIALSLSAFLSPPSEMRKKEPRFRTKPGKETLCCPSVRPFECFEPSSTSWTQATEERKERPLPLRGRARKIDGNMTTRKTCNPPPSPPLPLYLLFPSPLHLASRIESDRQNRQASLLKEKKKNAL